MSTLSITDKDLKEGAEELYSKVIKAIEQTSKSL